MATAHAILFELEAGICPFMASVIRLNLYGIQFACSDPHGEFGGKNVPIVLAKRNLEDEEGLSEARKKLHERRAQRPRPHLDDKVSVRIVLKAFGLLVHFHSKEMLAEVWLTIWLVFRLSVVGMEWQLVR